MIFNTVWIFLSLHIIFYHVFIECLTFEKFKRKNTVECYQNMDPFYLKIAIIYSILSLLVATGDVTNIGDKTSTSTSSLNGKKNTDDVKQSHDSNKKQKGLRMSKIARDHLSDEKNPNNFPKLIGIEFPGEYFFLFFSALNFQKKQTVWHI